MRVERQVPSLWLWLTVIAIGFSVVAYFQIVLSKSKHYVFENFVENRFSEFISENPGTKKVIIIGNSLTRCGIPFKTEENNYNFSYFRIVRDGYNLTDFIPLLNHLIEFNPDLILIDPYLMYADFNVPPDSKMELFKYLLGIEKYSIKRIAYLRQNSIYDDRTYNRITGKKSSPDLKFSFLESNLKINEAKLTEISAFFDQLNSKMTKAAFFVLPRSEKLNVKIRESLFFDSLKSATATVSAKSNIPMISVFDELPDSLYLDHSHLNQRGRKFFSGFLFNRIDSILAAAP